MFTKGSRLIAVVAALLLGGCLDKYSFETSVSPPEKLSLSGGRVMVYSLLDFREFSYGPNTLATIEKQIAQRLAESGVVASVVNFRGLPAGKYYSISSTSVALPLARLVESGRPLEAAFNPQYRLLILPSYTEVNTNDFRVTWILISVLGGQQIWSGQSIFHTDAPWAMDRDPEGKAKFLLDPVIVELKRQSLIN